MTTRVITEERKKRKKPEKLTHHLASEIATFRASLASVFGQIIVFAAFMDHFCSVPKEKSKKKGGNYLKLVCEFYNAITHTNIHICTHVHAQKSSPLSRTTRARARAHTHTHTPSTTAS
jgi:hypothetical protein